MSDSYNLASTTANPVSAKVNIKSSSVTTTNSSPNFKNVSPAIVQPNSIHVTPLPTTTFKPVLITSPGGTRSVMGTDGTFKKVN